MMLNEYDSQIINKAVERFGTELTVNADALQAFIETTNSSSVNKRRRLVYLAESLRSKLNWTQFYFVFRAALAEQPNDATYSTLLVALLNWYIPNESFPIEERIRAFEHGIIVVNEASAHSPTECSFMFMRGLLYYRHPDSEISRSDIVQKSLDWFRRAEDCYELNNEHVPEYIKMYQGHCLVALSDYPTALSIYQSVDLEILRDSTTEEEFAEFETNFALISVRVS